MCSPASVISDPVQQISQSHHLQPHHQQGYTAVQTVQSTPHLDIMRVYRALYDYTAQDHDEVSFQDGDVIISLQPVDEGWMYGTVQRTGQAGMLPANYVECLS
uniref:SH3 domain-containing protein n=1 Tax=Astyanax mexicanus TaxID=7994 RepID=A0A3B1J7H1_ASTMX